MESRNSIPHFQEDVSELFSHLQKRMQSSTVRGYAVSIEIVLFIGRFLPGSSTGWSTVRGDYNV